MSKNKFSSVQIARLAVQIIFLFLLPGMFINAFSGIKQIYLGVVNQDFSTIHILSLLELVALVPVTIIAGRFFCGWMCAFGTLGDILYTISSKVFKKNFKVDEKLDRILKYFKYVLLVFLISVVWTFNLSIFKGSNPWDAFGSLLTWGKVPDLSFALAEFTIGTFLLLAIIIASLFVERVFCRYLCPLGAFFSIISPIRLLRINKPSQKCGSCKTCTDSCAMGIPLYKHDEIKSGECIQCFKCVSSCPRKNVTIYPGKGKLHSGVAAALVITSIIIIFYGSNFIVKSSKSNTTSTDNILTPSPQISSQVSQVTPEVSQVTPEVSQVTPEVTQSPTEATSETSTQTIEDASPSNLDTTPEVSSEKITDKTTNNGNPVTTPSTSLGSTPASLKPDVSPTIIPENSPQSNSSVYRDGTYEGSAKGFRRGITTVSVVVKDNKITDIKIISHGDDKPYLDSASSVIEDMLNNQSTEVDVVSGATYSSNGIINAVKNALESAKIK